MARAIVRGMDSGMGLRGIHSNRSDSRRRFLSSRLDVEAITIPRVIFSQAALTTGSPACDVFPGQGYVRKLSAAIRPLCWREFDRLSVEFNFEIAGCFRRRQGQSSRNCKPRYNRVLDGDSRREYLRENGNFSREYLHKVFGITQPPQPCVERPIRPLPKRGKATDPDRNWAIQPAAAPFAAQTTRSFLEHK